MRVERNLPSIRFGAFDRNWLYRYKKLPTTPLRPYCVALVWACFLFGSTTLCRATEEPDFESRIAPILVARCLECHQDEEASGGLSLSDQESLLAGGDSGVAIDLERPSESYMLERILAGEMPPSDQGDAYFLPARERELLQAWIMKGADWPASRVLDLFETTTGTRAGRDWWSLQPIESPAIPKLQDLTQPENPIDAFVYAQLEEHSLHPAPQANRRVLIRRLYYDLLGLPPSHDEIESFVSDPDPLAWSKLIDQLLSSPQYGERWARYWLDVARYADTSGYERDQEKPFAWRYRDWVVDSFNQDKPYDQFVTEQLAGDEVADRSEQTVIATGFLRMGTWNDEPNDKADYQFDRLEDLVHTTSSAFLALTVKCARCHAHKFDPISQDDYYRMASVFWPGPIESSRSNDHLGGPTAEELGFDQVLGWTDVQRVPPPIFRLRNGERTQPLNEVVPQSISSISNLERTFDAPGNRDATTRRRLQLAQWIVDQRNPLPARVMVNRIWQHHFGAAIVRSPNNFGFHANPPTHPELLDWLATEFIRNDWSVKSLHRLILTSRTWQQSSLHPCENEIRQFDPSNRLLWKFNRRRLDAEAIRDSLLSVSNELDLSIGGESFKPTIAEETLEGLSRKSQAWQASPPRDQRRRSLYIYLKRGLLSPFLTTFDFCIPTLSCGNRNVTIVPTQALTLLNNQFVHDRSEQLAISISNQSDNLDTHIRQAWLAILKRPPTDDEIALSRDHIDNQLERIANLPSLGSDTPSLTQIDESLVFHIRASTSFAQVDEQSLVESIVDLSGNGHDVTQSAMAQRPKYLLEAIGNQPAIHFDGSGQFLHVDGQILQRPECTIVCVVSDRAESGHREIISNWNGASGNSTSSIFLGLTNESTVRFSDAFSSAGQVSDRKTPFVLTSVNGANQASVYQDGRLLATSPALSNRRLDTAWVIGQQGNIGGEYWNGLIAEIRIYDRDLSNAEQRLVENELASRFHIHLDRTVNAVTLSPEQRALASLCHVLMNTNEFTFVD